jgi:hypothetical protein
MPASQYAVDGDDPRRPRELLTDGDHPRQLRERIVRDDFRALLLFPWVM